MIESVLSLDGRPMLRHLHRLLSGRRIHAHHPSGVLNLRYGLRQEGKCKRRFTVLVRCKRAKCVFINGAGDNRQPGRAAGGAAAKEDLAFIGSKTDFTGRKTPTLRMGLYGNARETLRLPTLAGTLRRLESATAAGYQWATTSQRFTASDGSLFLVAGNIVAVPAEPRVYLGVLESVIAGAELEALVMVPEIDSTPPTILRFHERFNRWWSAAIRASDSRRMPEAAKAGKQLAAIVNVARSLFQTRRLKMLTYSSTEEARQTHSRQLEGGAHRAAVGNNPQPGG